MVESRWLRWVGPGIVALGAVALIGSATVGAGTRTWAPRACAGPPTDRKEAAHELTPATPRDLAAGPWFRLDPVAADDGSLGGARLVLGRFGDPLTRTLDLPVESFAAGPYGRTVLTGADDGTASRLGLVDIAGGCSWLVATERDVIRRATIDPAGGAIYEMRVDRATRADLGIWRRGLDGAAPAERILDPIGPDVLIVAYYASAEIGCHLALGWPVPQRVLDLFTEFRNQTNGIPPVSGAGLLS